MKAKHRKLWRLMTRCPIDRLSLLKKKLVGGEEGIIMRTILMRYLQSYTSTGMNLTRTNLIRKENQPEEA
jgi:hypothetical protein